MPTSSRPSRRTPTGEPDPRRAGRQDAHRRRLRPRARGPPPARARERVVPPARRPPGRPSGRDRTAGTRRRSPVQPLPGLHPYAGFGHLTGYGACYYTYQWSLVIARDLLSGFGADLMDPAVARPLPARDPRARRVAATRAIWSRRSWVAPTRSTPIGSGSRAASEAPHPTSSSAQPDGYDSTTPRRSIPLCADPPTVSRTHATSLAARSPNACPSMSRVRICSARGAALEPSASEEAGDTMSDHVPAPKPRPKNVAVRRTPRRVVAPLRSSAFTTALPWLRQRRGRRGVARLTARLRADSDEIAFLEERYRRVSEAASPTAARRGARRSGVAAQLAPPRPEVARRSNARRELPRRTSAREGHARTGERRRRARAATPCERLEAELATANARRRTPSTGRRSPTSSSRATARLAEPPQFEEILRVAEEQASLSSATPAIQGDRLLEAAREEIQNRRRGAGRSRGDPRPGAARRPAGAAADRDRADRAPGALEREAAHAAEKVSQAEQEAAAIRTEAEKGAAALRSMVARETTHARAEAEEAVRELRVRALEFEESLTRRQNDAQQEFLLLHNQAVAHAERITQDANDQVAASLEHAQRVAAKADDFERLMRAQARRSRPTPTSGLASSSSAPATRRRRSSRRSPSTRRRCCATPKTAPVSCAGSSTSSRASCQR